MKVSSRPYGGRWVYTSGVAKHLVDIDEEALGAARAELGTNTIRDTVNEALNRAAGRRSAQVKRSLERLARLELDDRDDAWR
jgi:Arc/MetJ family transcription regulator